MHFGEIKIAVYLLQTKISETETGKDAEPKLKCSPNYKTADETPTLPITNNDICAAASTLYFVSAVDLNETSYFN